MINGTDDTEIHAAARALERHHFLTPAVDADAFSLVRRHTTELKARFSRNLGYNLIVEPTFARLMKPVLPAGSPPRMMHTPSGTPVTARVYQYILLIAAAVQAPGFDEQLLISALITQVRADAAENGIATGDGVQERRDFVNAVLILTGWGVLTETDGSAVGWVSDDTQEALLTVNRPQLSYLIANPESLAGFHPERPGRDVLRRIVENPVITAGTLDEDEAHALTRERRTIETAVHDLFGLDVEFRTEGALLWGEDGDVTDEQFPGNGAPRQAALLFIEGAVTAGAREDDGWVRISRLDAEAVIDALIEKHKGMWRRDFHPDTADATHTAMDEVAGVLTRSGLLAEDGHGFRLHPAAGRYQPTLPDSPAIIWENPPEDSVRLFDDDEEQS
jgi:hypothetical protein